VSGFSIDWLSLREPFDHAARSTRLTDALAAALPQRGGPLRLIDLGCGHGSNLRYLAPRLSRPQAWTLVDHDPVLLSHAVAQPVPDGVSVVAVQRDLSAGVGDLPLDADVVVTSALLDLVSRPWLESLAHRCAAERLPLLAALTVDGRVSFSPADPRDADVMRWFRAHQRTDRGFGPSPGYLAADEAAGLLEAAGMIVETEQADWIIPASAAKMTAEMVRGIASASAACSPQPERVSGWLEARLGQVGALSMVVGHVDLLALTAGDV